MGARAWSIFRPTHGDELEPLRDRDRFAQFYLDYGLASIAWLDGQDFNPEFLYEKLKEMH